MVSSAKGSKSIAGDPAIFTQSGFPQPDAIGQHGAQPTYRIHWTLAVTDPAALWRSAFEKGRQSPAWTPPR